MALAVLLLVGADVRPQGADPSDKINGVVGYALIVAFDSANACDAPLAVTATQPLYGFVNDNQAAAVAFGRRPGLGSLDVIQHFPCVQTISVELDAYRQLGIATPERIKALLGGAGLREVQVEAASDGLRFAGSTGKACIAGVYKPRKTVVVVISPLPGRSCLS